MAIRDPAIILEVEKAHVVNGDHDAKSTDIINTAAIVVASEEEDGSNHSTSDNILDESTTASSLNDSENEPTAAAGSNNASVNDMEEQEAKEEEEGIVALVQEENRESRCKVTTNNADADDRVVKKNNDVIKIAAVTDISGSGDLSSPSVDEKRLSGKHIVGGGIPAKSPSSESSLQEPNKPDLSNAETAQPAAVKTWAGLFKNYSGAGGKPSKSASCTSTASASTVAVSTHSANSNNAKPFHQQQNASAITSTTHSAAPNENCFDVTQPINLPSFNTRTQQRQFQNKSGVGGGAAILNNNKANIVHSPPNTNLDEIYLRRIGEFLRGYKLDHRAVNFDLHGLVNRGNRCYMNATIQALIACPPFFNLMRNLAHHIVRANKGRYALRTHMPIIDNVTQIVSEFTNVNKQRKHIVQKGEGLQEITSAVSLDLPAINKLLSAIQNSETFVMGEQEDAQEFLTCFLNGLNDEMLELIQLTDEGATLSQIRSKNNTSNSNNNNNNVMKNNREKMPINAMSNGDIGSEVDDDSEWKEVQTKNKSAVIHRQNLRPTPLSEIFRGQLRSRLQKAGDQSTNNIEPFFTLHLNIEKAQTVKEALELMVGRDAIEGVTSSRTNQEVDAWQQQTLEELPCVLLLHLKCFDYKNHSCSKIIKAIEFPIDLRIDPKIMSQAAARSKPIYRYRQYKLFAVVYHDGKEATKGHYITDVFHVGYSGWLRYDDSKVYSVEDKEVLKPKLPRMPYLLYYRRCDTIAALMQQPPFINK